MAHLDREIFDGRIANVLRGIVRMDNNGGFIQMATNLNRDGTAIDVSEFDGLELLVQNGSKQIESFNVQYVNKPFFLFHEQYVLIHLAILFVVQHQDNRLSSAFLFLPAYI